MQEANRDHQILIYVRADQLLSKTCKTITEMSAGADPGFPVGGGVDPCWWGTNILFYYFSEKLHKSRKFWAVGGGSALNPPMEWITICNRQTICCETDVKP